MKEKISLKKAWHSTDAWRGYEEPVDAVCGANDTGTWDDSPCNSNTATKELNMAKAILRKAGIPFKSTVCRSSNVFCVHRYICVPSDRKDAAKSLLKPLTEWKTVCTKCGSDNILFDAWVKWNKEEKKYQVVSTFDNTFCVDCDCECSTKEIPATELLYIC